mgnify:CR=1 FL=1
MPSKARAAFRFISLARGIPLSLSGSEVGLVLRKDDGKLGGVGFSSWVHAGQSVLSQLELKIEWIGRCGGAQISVIEVPVDECFRVGGRF